MRLRTLITLAFLTSGCATHSHEELQRFFDEAMKEFYSDAVTQGVQKIGNEGRMALPKDEGDMLALITNRALELYRHGTAAEALVWVQSAENSLKPETRRVLWDYLTRTMQILSRPIPPRPFTP